MNVTSFNEPVVTSLFELFRLFFDTAAHMVGDLRRGGGRRCLCSRLGFLPGLLLCLLLRGGLGRLLALPLAGRRWKGNIDFSSLNGSLLVGRRGKGHFLDRLTHRGHSRRVERLGLLFLSQRRLEAHRGITRRAFGASLSRCLFSYFVESAEGQGPTLDRLFGRNGPGSWCRHGLGYCSCGTGDVWNRPTGRRELSPGGFGQVRLPELKQCCRQLLCVCRALGYHLLQGVYHRLVELGDVGDSALEEVERQGLLVHLPLHCCAEISGYKWRLTDYKVENEDAERVYITLSVPPFAGANLRGHVFRGAPELVVLPAN